MMGLSAQKRLHEEHVDAWRLIINVNYQIFRKIINDKCGVRFSIPVMHKCLHRHDLCYKKPKGFPHKANPQ